VEAREEGEGHGGLDERHGEVPERHGEVGELDGVRHFGEGEEARGGVHFEGEEEEGDYGGDEAQGDQPVVPSDAPDGPCADVEARGEGDDGQGEEGDNDAEVHAREECGAVGDGDEGLGRDRGRPGGGGGWVGHLHCMDRITRREDVDIALAKVVMSPWDRSVMEVLNATRRQGAMGTGQTERSAVNSTSFERFDLKEAGRKTWGVLENYALDFAQTPRTDSRMSQENQELNSMRCIGMRGPRCDWMRSPACRLSQAISGGNGGWEPLGTQARESWVSLKGLAFVKSWPVWGSGPARDTVGVVVQ